MIKYGLFYKKGEKAVLILSRESTNALFRNYSDFFQENNVNGEMGIELKKEVTLENLINQFRGYLALDVLMAFVNENSVQALEEYKLVWNLCWMKDKNSKKMLK